MSDKNLDRFLYGGEAIGREADIYETDEDGEIVLDENGKPKVDLRKVYHALERGYIDADKFGPRIWRSTPRRIRQIA
jgi:hypothetical protein